MGAEGYAAHRRQAFLWAGIISATVATFAFLALKVVPWPPAGMGFSWPPKGQAGISLRDLAAILALGAAAAAAITAAQELVWRPRLRGDPFATEKIFFASSLAARAVFAVTLLYHHYGPGGHASPAVGDAGHRVFLVGLFYAAYSSDLYQLLRHPGGFASAFVPQMVAHHLLSLGWFGLWMAFLAPRGPGGAPIWNTAIIYLSGCTSNHLLKLVTCYYRPPWIGYLTGPATAGHWLILMSSQAYFFSQCPCSAYGCWYPGSVVMILGAWGMVLFDIRYFIGAVVISNSRLLGTPIVLEDIPGLILGRQPNRGPKNKAATASQEAGSEGAASGAVSAVPRTAFGPTGANAWSDGPDGEDSGSSDEGPIVTAQLVFGPADSDSAASKPPRAAGTKGPTLALSAPKCSPPSHAERALSRRRALRAAA